MSAGIRRSPLNGAEWQAYNKCYEPGSQGATRGALWFNITQGDYYNDRNIVVDSDARSIDVFLRGSAYGCRSSVSGKISATAIRAVGSNAWRIRFDGNRLYRGDLSAPARDSWSTQGSTLNGTLDVSGIATNNIGKDDSQTISINIFRCFERDGIGGDCYGEPVQITIERKARPNAWTLQAQSGIRKLGQPGYVGQINDTKVGDILQWNHTLRNNSDFDMNRSSRYVVDREDFSDGAFNNTFGNRPPSGDIRLGRGQTFSTPDPPNNVDRSNYLTYRVGTNDAGRNLCQRIAAQPGAWNNGGYVRAGWACAFVPYSYGLTPLIDRNPSLVESDSETIRVTSKVNLDSGSTRSRETDWRVVRLVYKPGQNPFGSSDQRIENGGDAGKFPCDFYSPSRPSNCDEDWQRDQRYVFESSQTRNYTDTFGGDYELGAQVCYATAVSRPTHNNTPTWRYSGLQCVQAAKRPKVQVWGGDVRTQKQIVTNTSSIKGKTYGSWDEFGALSRGDNTQFTSGAAMNNGQSSFTLANNHRLTFANIGGQYGNFDSIGSYQGDSLIGSFGSGTTQPFGGGSISGLNGRYASALSTLTISESKDIGAGRSIIINASGTVRINGDITYRNGGYSNINDIPQVVVIADNIIVNDSVKQIDAWLLARNRINTCNVTRFSDLRANRCDEQLRINGPVATNQLWLFRTAKGDKDTPNDPAELINLRADALLWTQARATGNGVAQTVYTREAPPRY